ncbi:MAG: Ribosome maturation factor RimM, partial [Actinomycetota bacterium]
SGREWGKVVDVLQLPAQDTLVVAHKGREVLVPFVKAYVPEVDIETKRLTIINFAGLL